MRVSNGMGIGPLARRAGCTVPTIRYYEEIGLLPRAKRNGGRQRVYAEADLRRLTFIRRCRDFGFSIEQVKELVALAGSPERDCIAARDLAREHLDTVRQKLKELRALERSMNQFVTDCESQCAGGPVGDCVILIDLATPTVSPCCKAASKVPASLSRPCCGKKA